MRILALTDLYPPFFLGGYELSCKAQMDELSRRGHEIHVLTSQWGQRKGKSEHAVYRRLYLDHLHFDLNRGRQLRGGWPLTKRYYQARWAIACRANYWISRTMVRQVQPDLVYVWNMSNVGISPVLGAQALGQVIVFNLCDYWLRDLKMAINLDPHPLKRYYHAAIIGLSDINRLDLQHLLLCSQSLKQHYAAAGFLESRMRVIPRGISGHLIIDPAVQRKPPDLKDGIRLIFAGRLVPEKGIDTAIEAVNALRQMPGIPPIRFDIVGTGQPDHIRHLHDLVSTYGLTDTVMFLGKLERQQVLDCFADYHALLFPSRWAEPFGVTILEAMARGLPVIASRQGAASEIIRDGQNGLLVPPDDPHRLADAIKSLVEHPALAQMLRRDGLRTVRETYSNERILDEVEEYITEAVKSVSPASEGV